MSTFGDALANIGLFTKGYAESLLKDIPSELAGRKPRFQTPEGLKVIDTNHPAFVFGHLALYPCRAWVVTGAGDGGAVQAPSAWNDLFAAGVECKDDVEGTIYPRLDELAAKFFSAQTAACDYVRTLDDSVFALENPNERSRSRFPTVGTLLIFLLGGHPNMHLGQISAWRRCYGLASAMP